MTTLKELQTHLKDTNRYSGGVDGLWGPLTAEGVQMLFEDGADTPLTDMDFVASAVRLGVTPAQIRAVTKVESAGAGFFAGRPLILPEPHRFSKATGHIFDTTHPTVSYPAWGTLPYPKTQAARYAVLLSMIQLDVDAGFGSASYGKFQVMGENHKACGYASSMLFAEAMARDEVAQLAAFEKFLATNGLIPKLKACTSDPETCRAFCKGYNGTGYEKNNYHIKIAAEL